MHAYVFPVVVYACVEHVLEYLVASAGVRHYTKASVVLMELSCNPVFCVMEVSHHNFPVRLLPYTTCRNERLTKTTWPYSKSFGYRRN